MTDRDIQKDRLIELLAEAEKEWKVYFSNSLLKGETRSKTLDEFIADHILANGAIVLPCEIGQKLYDATEFFNGCLYPEIYELKENGMYLEKTNKGNIVFTYDGMYIKSEDIGDKIFLTKEEAEEKLKELGK